MDISVYRPSENPHCLCLRNGLGKVGGKGRQGSEVFAALHDGLAMRIWKRRRVGMGRMGEHGRTTPSLLLPRGELAWAQRVAWKGCLEDKESVH